MAEIKINPIQLVTVGNYNAVINTIVTDSYDFLGGVVIEKNGQERSTWWGDSGIARDSPSDYNIRLPAGFIGGILHLLSPEIQEYVNRYL
ncbi:hypothetical protein ACRU1U_19320 [Providencia stuartii]|uniref:hypothetical protein n=1 Tax=Providencia stuartii TaxID=588 RepID=UPI0004F8D77C|nr:hypothetical protein [Providencia stuartii]AIN62780.1 hypothetical protein DR96_2677 [Providencia stuartii]MBK1422552.1 hypothetical protein [Providencia stuartii]MDK7736506.1 hypothetical protein [Providencia stuartii]MTC67156.1 hypothetical protein [Providencia stuartii]QQC51187.1 hypothetical protein I6H97_12885 [Providencia stuartii]